MRRWGGGGMNVASLAQDGPLINEKNKIGVRTVLPAWGLPPPNQALQRAAGHINCSAAGDLAKSAPERWRARVLKGRRAVAELSSYAASERPR